MDKLIYMSMKKVLTEELKNIEADIKKLFEKWGCKEKEEFLKKADKEDVDKFLYLDEQYKRILKCLEELF
ncbi:conserved hypothetical protein [Methanocaldococcus infernus ME]|uniref:Uncharacterized protein n=1 Tax=Methanocaldococcus infernus (strain DSM 11812 / JCM 15783 / ME) TaxID=573063 RepID=D5VSU0_METIM|nr:conserved hypothetical protein [Methanocaldococcus infernus ME]